MNLSVVKGGVLTTIQDLGRVGCQHLGVVVGGAADPFLARLANLLVGNAENAALFEMALTGPELRFEADTLIAWCGADFDARLDGVPLRRNRPVRVRAGEVASFGAVRAGARAWLSVAGGIDVPAVLGSRSTCRRFGFGGFKGRALVAGDRLRIGPPSTWAQSMMNSLTRQRRTTCDWSVRPESLGAAYSSKRFRAIRGPEWDWFAREAQARFFDSPFRVTKEADRMGVRLEGPALALAEPREMISSGVNVGVVQTPPGGQPIILLCSRQTVGGYPRLAAVATVDQGRLAQLKQGDVVAFEEIDLNAAHTLYLARERDFHQVRHELARRAE